MKLKSEIRESVLPDLVLTNGKIITVDSHYSIAEAVAVKNGKIAAVGTRDEIKTISGKNTKVIDLKGATMLPGINDSHCHVSDWALTRPPWKLNIRFPVVKSIADIVKMVTEAAVKTPAGEWIQGEGWDQGYLDECLANPVRLPSKEDLDRVAPANPVVLVEYSGHRMWVNSIALELAGIRKDTPDPVGGRRVGWIAAVTIMVTMELALIENVPITS
jgi:predicted amidohydrolase YtcJ